jgi:CRISPR-associated protein Cmr2
MAQRFAEKVAAFLARPPYAALDAGDSPAWGLAEAALGRPLSPEERSAAVEAERGACGLDIPSWVPALTPQSFVADPLTTHPLSGARRPLVLPSAVGADLREAVTRNLARLRDEAGNDPRKLFLLLWRLLPDRLAGARPEVPWRELPADARIPSHTWWEHACVASALAGAGPRPAVLLFTIAGAQEFVATARRTQDSWMGSFLLSYLSWQAVQVFAEACGPDAVLSPSLCGQPLVDLWLRQIGVLPPEFPLPKDRLRVGNVPNLFTALVPEEEAEGLAAQAEAAVRRAWKQIADAVRGAAEASLQRFVPDIQTWGPLWDRQIPDLPDRLGLYWGYCPWDGGDPRELARMMLASPEGDEPRELAHWEALYEALGHRRHAFGTAYPWLAGFAAQAMTARKNLRDFRQTGADGEPGHKCTLCGQLEQLHPASIDGSSAGPLARFWETLGSVDRDRGRQKLLGRVRRGERLCAVCLTKRLALETYFDKALGLDHHLFPSTSTVAAGQFLLDVLQAGEEPLQKLLAHTRGVAQTLGDAQVPANAPEGVRRLAQGAISDAEARKGLLELDGDWLYGESFQADPLERELGLRLDEDTLRRCRDGAERLRKSAAAAGIPPPSKYYAVVALDGDKMGEWLMGRQGPKWEAIFHPGAQPTADQTQGLPRPPVPAVHLALSDGLKAFSLDLVKPVVDQYGGALLYAGGDDVLALVPTARLYRVLGDLRERFTGDETGWFGAGPEARRVLGGPGGMTVSAGVAIVHRSHELSVAVQEAQELLKDRAKARFGRDAFALGLLRRSGEATVTGGRFAGGGAPLLDALQAVLDLMRSGRLSTRFAYRVRGCTWAAGTSAPDALRAVVLRLARQHAKSEDDRAEARKAADALFQAVEQGVREMPDPRPDLWEHLSGLLLVTAFLSGRED